jgi:phosphatidylglycerol:prolipoprotein diacylglycerol transferase
MDARMTFAVLGALQYPHVDPVIVRLGPLAVRWYGVAYLLGFALCYVALRGMIRRGILRLGEDVLAELLMWLVVGVMAGGRLGWWLFYHHNIHDPEPWYEPIAIWHGGMSFHGGLLGVTLAILLWSWRRRRGLFWNLADCAALVVPIGLFFGRIANFINAELVGRPTTVPWAVVFPGDAVARHPSQLYEAMLEGPVLLTCMWAARRLLRPREGQLAALFLVLYGIFRFAVEFTRQPDEQIGFVAFGWLTMGQLLSVLLASTGTILLLLKYRVSLATADDVQAAASPFFPEGVQR